MESTSRDLEIKIEIRSSRSKIADINRMQTLIGQYIQSIAADVQMVEVNSIVKTNHDKTLTTVCYTYFRE